jgi:glycosyltransferase involved in cell wall biosynthesis
MSKLKLSVVLCTHNGEAYLCQQLDSLLNQVRLPDQIVVGDDASIDGTWQLIERFRGKAESVGIDVRLIRRPLNIGFVRNFSETLNDASGDVIFLCDQDDRWLPDKLSAMEAKFVAEPDLLMLWTNARLVDSKGASINNTLFEALELTDTEIRDVGQGGAFDVLLRRSMATGATAAMRRAVLPLALPVGDGWIHDEWLAIVLSAIGRVGMLEQPLIDYRQHERNQLGMRKRSLEEKWRGLTGSWEAQFQREVVRLDSLERHVETLGKNVKPCVLPLIVARREHFQRRIAMGKHPRWLRIAAIWREASRGGYRRFGTGRRSMLRDLLRHD